MDNPLISSFLILALVGGFFLLVTSMWPRRREEDDQAAEDLPNAHTPDDDGTELDAVDVPRDTVPVPAPLTEPVILPEPFVPSFEVAHAPVEEIEGGYQRYPQDRGNYNNKGELVGTNWGIAAPVAEDYFRRTVTEHDMRTLAKSVALDIYRRKFWEPMKGDQFPNQELANIVYDGFVNHGRWGIRLLQRALGIKEDGIVGPFTLASIHHADPDQLYRAYYEARYKFYHAIVRNRPSQEIFLRGWLRRLRYYEPDRR